MCESPVGTIYIISATRTRTRTEICCHVVQVKFCLTLQHSYVTHLLERVFVITSVATNTFSRGNAINIVVSLLRRKQPRITRSCTAFKEGAGLIANYIGLLFLRYHLTVAYFNKDITPGTWKSIFC